MSDILKIKYVGDLHKITPEPGDVFLLHCNKEREEDMALRLQMERSIYTNFNHFLPGYKLMILYPEHKLSIIKNPLHIQNINGE